MPKKSSVSCGKFLDIAHVGDIKNRISNAFEKAPEVLTLTADKVERADSAGLQLILVTLARCHKHQIEFKLVKPSSIVHTAINLLGMSNHISI